MTDHTTGAGPTGRIALLGTGIAGSLTPALHEREGRALGLDLGYGVVDVTGHTLGPEDVHRVLRTAAHHGYLGLNITHPFKRMVLPLLHDLSPAARALGAVNTVQISDGRLLGHNTDHSGFLEGLRTGQPTADPERVVLIGCGGAGSAVAYALLEFGVRTLVVLDMDASTAERLGRTMQGVFPDRRVVPGTLDALPQEVRRATGLVNATPMGMTAHPGSAVPAGLLDPRLWVADVVYRPVETQLVRDARLHGCRVVTGVGMAIGQAVGAFRIFTGTEPSWARMTATMADVLAAEEAGRPVRNTADGLLMEAAALTGEAAR